MKRALLPQAAALFLASNPASTSARRLGGEATVGGAFPYRGDNHRYYRDRFSNGQERCRDRETGYFAKDSRRTDVRGEGYAKIAIAAQPFGGLELGGSRRFTGESLRPYSFVAAPLAPRLRIVGAEGEHYLAFGLRAGF